MVELLAQAHLVCAAGVEGQVDHRALGPEQLQRQSEVAGLPPALEHHVRAAVAWGVAPALLERDGRILLHGLRAERLGDAEPFGGLVHDDDLRRAVPEGEAGGQQADHARARDRHAPSPHPVAQTVDGGPVQVGGGVQQAVGADRAHVGDVDAEQRVEVVGKFDEAVLERVGDVARAVTVGHRQQCPLTDGGGPGLGDHADLHVADAAHRVLHGRHALGEQAER
ncbi:hypothetical protein GCM10020219_030080 [Nonomuraea dietziae]